MAADLLTLWGVVVVLSLLVTWTGRWGRTVHYLAWSSKLGGMIVVPSSQRHPLVTVIHRGLCLALLITLGGTLVLITTSLGNSQIGCKSCSASPHAPTPQSATWAAMPSSPAAAPPSPRPQPSPAR